MFPDRYPIQPWLYPLSDLRPQSGAVFQKFTGDALIMAWHIRGIAEDPAAMLGIRIQEGSEDRKVVTAVIAERGRVVEALGGIEPNFDLSECDGD